MALIELQNYCADFPIYNVEARSLKRNAMRVATGGVLGRAHNGVPVVRALDKLNLHITDGEKVAVFGHNGAGKSTLLRVLSGVYAPTEGSIHIDGKIGSLIDISLGIDTEASGIQNIYLRGALIGLDRQEIESKLDEIIEFSELGDFIQLPVRTYSTGMHMRLAFAVSTIMRPEILLMDEWLSVGDADFNEKAEEKLNTIVDNSKILVMATHSMENALRNCNRAIWLEHGRIRMDGTVEDVAAQYWNLDKVPDTV